DCAGPFADRLLLRSRWHEACTLRFQETVRVFMCMQQRLHASPQFGVARASFGQKRPPFHGRSLCERSSEDRFFVHGLDLRQGRITRSFTVRKTALLSISKSASEMK